MTVLLREWIKNRIMDLVGLAKFDGIEEEERLTLINDADQIVKQKLEEYNVWYQGDSDELLNYYTRATHIDWNYEPWYSRNKRGFFWSISSTESDIKRTHSGMPRNITDTIVSLIGTPTHTCGTSELTGLSDATLKAVLEENNFWSIRKSVQLPMTLVEGWGAWKIDWDQEISDNPILKYYRADKVEYIFRDDRLCGMMFKDYYTDGKFHNYLIIETRYNYKKTLYITHDVFRVDSSGSITVLDADNIPEELSGIDLGITKIENYNKLLAQPCVYYKDVANNDGYGRSIFCGKVSLFDDMDQCLSQASNTVRRSTAIEYFNTDFLERDRKTGLPKMPTAYDRKYTGYKGGRAADGSFSGDTPVQVTQPQLNFEQYNQELVSLQCQCISGLISPATMGIDIARKDNADAQREKEKITIFTRNFLIEEDSRMLKGLFNQILEAVQLMKTQQCTCHDYSISIKYSEFADDSYENKLKALGEAYSGGTISTDMYLKKLYGSSLSDTDYAREKKYLEENKKKADDPFGGASGDPFEGM